MKVIHLICLFAYTGLLHAAPVRLIVDTDIGPDFDDVGALAVMHALADAGEVEILATISCNRHDLCVPTIEIINAHYGRSKIPVGVVRVGGVELGDDWHKRKWPEALVAKYAANVLHARTTDTPSAVSVYRRKLASAPDGSVVICAIGFHTNLADLIGSGPDADSPLDGLSLVKRKVRALYTMAGYAKGGREFNVYKDATSARKVFADWPTEIVISPAELGNRIRTGLRVAALETDRSPIRDAFAIAIPQNRGEARQSWDQTAVYAAIRGGSDLFTSERGCFTVDGDGNNTWAPVPDGRHVMLNLAVMPEQAARKLEDLMACPPRNVTNVHSN